MAKKILKKSLFITFEGPEGCGKSTHAKKICAFLKNNGYDCVFTREPGGTPVGDRIRKVLLDPGHRGMGPMTEALLFEASRSVLLEEVIRPALNKKKIVICDRFSDSTVVYQGYAGRLPLREIKRLDTAATGGIKPDLTIILDVNAGTGLKRAAAKRQKDRMELKSLDFHRKVRAGFLEVARKDKKRVRVIKVRAKIEQTQAMVRGEVLKAIGEKD